ncbi:MAG: metallophosphoesterase family protein [Actinomycetota bacterium]|nr:metallophosphoesterase family protein [Actinomycetota bacterium]
MRAAVAVLAALIVALAPAHWVQPSAAAQTMDLRVSSLPDRSSPSTLEGATLAGNVYVFAVPGEPVSEVRFWVDDPTMSGTADKVEKSGPYDLAGTNTSTGTALPYDVSALGPGSHVVTARATFTAGGSVVTSGTFTVEAATAPDPTADGVLVSGFSDRSAALPLEGATLSGDAYIFATPDEPVHDVRFWLDDISMSGPADKVEKNAPYDYAGTVSGSRLANPLNADRLTAGGHTMSVRLTRTDGTTSSRHSTFTVGNGTQEPPADPGTPIQPDQIHLAWTQSPSTTLTVVWHTQQTASPSVVEYRPTGSTAWLIQTGALRPSETDGTLHETTLTDLSPDTSYEYRVPGDGGAWSAVFEARTAPAPGPADFDVVYFADTGIAGRTDGLTTGTTAVLAEIDALDPLFVLPGGDYAYYNTETRYADLDEAIDAWLNQVQPIASGAPMMPVYGNHEARLSETVEDWAPRFPTPSGWNGRRAYSFNVGDVHFVALFAVSDTGAMDSSEYDWLAADLAVAAAGGARWIVPYFHVAPFADGFSHPSNEALRGQVGPLFEQYGIDVVLTSHDQSYERTYPLVDVGGSNAPTTNSRVCLGSDEGTTYVKTSPAGKLSNKNGTFSVFQTYPPPAWTAVRDDTMHHYTRLRFSASGVMRVETYGIPNGGGEPIVVDSFEYRLAGCTTDASLAFDPPRMSVRVTQDEPAAAVTATITASGGPTGPVALAENASWLSAPATVAPGSVQLGVDATGLAPGLHTATVFASSATHGTAQLVVELSVGSTGADQLMVSAASTRSDPIPLDDAVLAGSGYVFLTGAADADRVRFWLDDPTATSIPWRTESNPPYDFNGGTVETANAWDTSPVPHGSHTITAVIDSPFGQRLVTSAFTVS